MIGLVLLAALIGVAIWPFWQERRRLRLNGAARTGVPGEFIKLSRGVVRYEWHGPVRGPVLIAVHGLTTPPAVFGPMIPGLNALGFRVLTYDLWGRGWSDTPAGQQDAAYFRAQLTELLDALELDQDLTLMGYSMGGAIVTDFAAVAPERVKRVILLASAGLQLDESRFEAFCRQVPWLGDWAHLALAPRRMQADIAIDLANHGQTKIAAAQQQGLARQGYLPSVLASRRGILATVQSSAHQELGRLAVPVLALWGEKDNVIPLSALGLLAQWNRAAKQEVIADAGHGVTFTHSDALVDHLRDMLREKDL